MTDDSTILSRLERLEKARSKGPWKREGQFIHGPVANVIGVAYDGGTKAGEPEANLDFIEAVENALPALLAVCDALTTQWQWSCPLCGRDKGDRHDPSCCPLAPLLEKPTP